MSDRIPVWSVDKRSWDRSPIGYAEPPDIEAVVRRVIGEVAIEAAETTGKAFPQTELALGRLACFAQNWDCNHPEEPNPPQRTVCDHQWETEISGGQSTAFCAKCGSKDWHPQPTVPAALVRELIDAAETGAMVVYLKSCGRDYDPCERTGRAFIALKAALEAAEQGGSTDET
jgi:hypothetical protein